MLAVISRDLFQEEQNRGKPNWEHLNEDLHVLITVEDAQNRAEIKLKRAVEEVNKLLVPAVSSSHITSCYSLWLLFLLQNVACVRVADKWVSYGKCSFRLVIWPLFWEGC